jgi:hypothetical protein
MAEKIDFVFDGNLPQTSKWTSTSLTDFNILHHFF